MKIKNLCLAVAACFALAGPALADEVRIVPATQNTTAGSTVNAAIEFVADSADGAGNETGAFEVVLTFPAELTITPTAANGAQECAVIAPGQIRLQRSAEPGDVTTNIYCNLSIAVAGGAAPGPYALAFDPNSDRFESDPDVAAPGTHTLTDGEVVVVTGPSAPVISIADGTANGLGVGTAAVTKVDGSGAPTSSYTCTAPAGFTLTSNASQTGIANGDPDPADIGFTCSPGAMQVTQTMNCTITEGGVARADTVDLTCPALAPVNPTITSSPADGSTTNIPGGLVGSTRQTTINFTATGANSLGTATIDCSASGAVSIAPSGPQTVVGTAQPVDPAVSCTLTDVEQNGSVTCSITDGNPSATRTTTYNFVCPAGSTFLPAPEPTVVTATSLWSKIGLIGLLAALGMLMVGFRRNH
jgi:hypothetical protein